jgi:hypothetical protein
LLSHEPGRAEADLRCCDWKRRPPHSHSIVPGGLLVTSYTTRLMPFTSLMMRVATRARKACSKG